MKKIFAILFVLTIGLWTGCSDEAEMLVDTTPQIRVTCNTDLRLPSSNATEGTITYQVLYPMGGDLIAEAESSASWLRPHLSAKGTLTTSSEGLPMLSAKITYSVTANKGEARTATLTLTYAGKHSVELTIRQPEAGTIDEKKTIITLSSASASVAAEAGQQTIEYVVTNPTSGVATASSSATWAKAGSSTSGTLSKNSTGEDILTATIPVTYEENTGSERTAKITLSYGDLSAIYTLKQAATAGGGGDEPGEEPGDEPGDNPVVPSEMAGSYMLVWKISGAYKAATPASTYYILSKDVTVSDHTISASGNSDAVWQFESTSVEGQYTLKDSTGKYYAMKGTYSSFNTSTTLTDSELSYNWTISSDSDGSWTIMNVDKQKWMQWDSSFGNAIASTSTGAKPMLFKLNAAGTAYENLNPVDDGGDDNGGNEGGETPVVPTDGKTLVAGWAELPVHLEKSGDYYYTWHITDAKYSNGNKARNYTVCYSKDKMCAMWVAAPMHKFYIQGDHGRTEAYATDPNFDFTQPGKWSGYSRGHLIASNNRHAGVTSSKLVNKQVFYYSNIAPQISNFNSGDWGKVDNVMDNQWESRSDTTYAVYGCYWENNQGKEVINGTKIPTHYYMVMLRAKSGVNKWVGNCSADELQCIAVMMEHKDWATLPALSTFAMSVADLEKLTGFSYFGNVPNAPKNTCIPSDWGM